jgi:phage gp29-like protein
MSKPHLTYKNYRQLQQLFSMSQSDPNMFNLMLELPNPDPILRKAGKSPLIYDEIARDAHVIGELRSLRAGMFAFNAELVPGADDAASLKSFELAKKFMAKRPRINTEWMDIDWHNYSAILYGFAVTHLGQFHKTELGWQPSSIETWPASRFVFTPDHELLVKTKENPHGEPTHEHRWTCVRHMPSSKNPYGVALLSSCFWPWTFKHGGFKFFVQLCERFGVPFPIGKYPVGKQDGEVDELMEGLAKLITDGIATIPDDTSIEILESKVSGDPVQLQLIKLCNSEMSKAITSQTLATEQQDGGARAASETHAKRAGENQRADRALVASSRNQILETLHQVNFDGGEAPRYVFRDRKEINLDTVNTIRETAKLVDVGVDYVYRTLGVPRPQKDEELLDVQDDGNGIASAAKQDFAGADSAHTDVTTFDEFDQASSEQIAKLYAFAKSANSLPELKTQILNAYPDLTESSLKVVLSEALELEFLQGMADANNVENTPNE